MNFEIPLSVQKVKPHQVTALHLIIALALIGGSAIALLLNNTVIELPDGASAEAQKIAIEKFDLIDICSTITLVIGTFILISALFRNRWLTSTNVNRTYRIIELVVLIVICICLLFLEFTIPALLYGILAATVIFALSQEKNEDKYVTVLIDDTGIHLPKIRRKDIRWAETEQVLLRHGTLTVNCVDNRLYQYTTSPNTIDKDAFEAYCSAQVEAARPDRKKYDW